MWPLECKKWVPKLAHSNKVTFVNNNGATGKKPHINALKSHNYISKPYSVFLYFFLHVCIPSGWGLARWRCAALWAPHSPSGLHGILQGSSHPPAEPQLWRISTLHGCREGRLWWCEISFVALNVLLKIHIVIQSIPIHQLTSVCLYVVVGVRHWRWPENFWLHVTWLFDTSGGELVWRSCPRR